MDNSSVIHLASYGTRGPVGEKTCSVVGCKDQSIFTHRVPSQVEIKSKLIDFIFDCNAPASLPKKCSLFVCKNHFSLDSYENIGMVLPGFEGTWILKRGLGAIMPTNRLSTSSSQQENKHSQGYSTAPMLRADEVEIPIKSYSIRRENSQSSTQQDTHNQCYSTPLMLKVEDPDKTDSVSSMRPGHRTYQQYLRSRGGLIGPSEQIVRSVGTQLSRNTLVYRRSQGSQTTEATQTRVLTVSVAIGTPVQWKRPPPIQFRKPFKPSKRRGLKQDDHGVFTEPYIPGEPVSTESMLSQASPSINDVPKFIVDEYCLLELFEDCPACGFVCEVKKTIRGTFLAVHQMCLQCNFSRNWKSQRLEAVPSGDPRSCTSDPESSAAAITEIIGFSDEKLSLEEGPSEDPETSVAAITEIIGFSDENDSSDEGSSEEDHNSDSDWDPLQHHNIDSKFADSESDEDAGSESDADKKHEKYCRKLCPECGAFFYSQTHTCENKKPYSCNLCGKRFLSEGHLKAHSKTHEDGYKHVCKYCFSTFGTRSDKLVHEQSHPPARKPYQCPDCPKVFAKMQERSDHLVSHRGPKRHICHVCNMEFFNGDQLQRHVAVHTKVKQFVCEVCQRSFTQSTHLKSHMRVHTGEKPYQCQHCDKSFNHNVSLKSHIQRYHGQLPDPGEKVQMKKTRRNEFETERDETDEMERSVVDAEEAERSKDTLCNPDDEEEEEEEEEEKAEKVGKIRHYKSSGRPKGRPKRNAVFTSRSVSEVEKDDANQMDSSTADVEEAKTDEMESSGVDADEAEQSNTLCIPENGADEEKKERVGKRKRCTVRPIGRPKKNAMIIPDDANQ